MPKTSEIKYKTRGLIESKFSRPAEITITRRNLVSLSRFAERGCMTHSDNKKAVRDSEIIILAVKPYNYAEIIKESTSRVPVLGKIIDKGMTAFNNYIAGESLNQVNKVLKYKLDKFRENNKINGSCSNRERHSEYPSEISRIVTKRESYHSSISKSPLRPDIKALDFSKLGKVNSIQEESEHATYSSSAATLRDFKDDKY